MRAPTLIIGVGNPSRGDDALGTAAVTELACRMAKYPGWGQVEVMTDFQLQIEFVTDLVDRQRIVFIDATIKGAAPFSFYSLDPAPNRTITTHALSPASLLTVYRNFHGEEAPPSFLLCIRGYDFDLGVPLSAGAERNLDAALVMLERWLTVTRPPPRCL